MCKHKSGGMSKPSTATNQTSGIASNSTAPCTSPNCASGSTLNAAAVDPNSSSSTTGGATTTNQNSQLKTETLMFLGTTSNPLESVNSFQTMAIGTQREGSSSQKVYNLEQTEIHVSSIAEEKETECLNSLPIGDVAEGWNRSCRPESPESDDDHITEDSPMLTGQDLPTGTSKAWNTNLPILHPWGDTSTAFKNLVSSSNYACASSPCSTREEDSYAVSCDKNPTFRNLKYHNNYHLPNSFVPHFGNTGCSVLFDGSADVIEMTEDNPGISGSQCKCSENLGSRRPFVNHKCKSLESDSNPVRVHNLVSQVGICHRSTSLQSADGRTMECANKSLLADTSNSCLTAYSASTVNTEPLPGPSGLQRPNSIHWEIGTRDNEDDEEFRCRSFSLTPTVNFAIFETESSSETEDSPETDTLTKLEEKHPENILKEIDPGFQISLPSITRVLAGSPSAAQLSLASSFGDNGAPICKICHMTAKESDPLISPCRCSGTMQYIHCGCLMRWLEISSKRSRKPPSCELCQYQYHWHKKFKVNHWQFPHCSRRDKILHLLFFISVMVMIACATITIMCFKQDKGTKVDPDRTELTHSEIVTLVCGVLFFLAFFVAMYVEVKARNTIYRLLVKFVYLNQQWYIDEYDKKENSPVAV